MDTISSAQFRKTYASLAVPVIVTVNGHPIGTWMPRSAAEDRDRMLNVPGHMRLERGVVADDGFNAPLPGEHGFNTRPFTPVPKTSK